MILDLIAPLTEKYVYKIPSQIEAWGSDLSFGVIILPVYFSSEFLENIFMKGKRRTDPDLIYQLGNLTLGALSYFSIGTSSGGTRIETKNRSGSWLGGTL